MCQIATFDNCQKVLFRKSDSSTNLALAACHILVISKTLFVNGLCFSSKARPILKFSCFFEEKRSRGKFSKQSLKNYFGTLFV